MQKYLKITQEDFRKAYEILHRVQNSFSSVFGFTRLEKFRTGCEIHFSQSCSLSCSLYSFQHFAQPCKIARCQISSLILFLAYLIDLEKASKLSKTWILHVFELQLAFPWTIQNSPSFLARFNDKKAIKNTKTCEKTIRNICMGL